MSDQPTGIVALLFTDIEGYSSLTEREGEVAAAAVRMHEDIVRRISEDHGGYIFKTLGDAFYIAFAGVPDAISAAVKIQSALHACEWPTTTPILVRMAIHAGTVEARGGDYFGAAVNRCARLLPLGHGGQSLISEAARELIADAVSPGYTLQPLGQYRLKDLVRPEQICQVNVPGLPHDFQPLRSVDISLPIQLTSFVGRISELAEIGALMARVRLVTLTGFGGSGKTRLALEAAEREGWRFMDGVRLIELADVEANDEAGLYNKVAASLGLKEAQGLTLVELLVRHLQHRDMLLVLDNCEHIRDWCSRLAETILHSCINVKILATSRELFGISAESEYMVEPLPIESSAGNVEPDAVKLFVERARLVKSNFTLTAENEVHVASICRRLDGLPFAIELAAAHVRMLSPKQIDSHLFRVVKSDLPSGHARHRNIESLMDWSCIQLTHTARKLLGRLSLLPGGWDLEGAEAICAGDGIAEEDVLELMSRLRSASLVIAIETAYEENRYRMLETVRAYASERLILPDEIVEFHERMTKYYLRFAEAADEQLIGTSQSLWAERTQAEYPNIRLAISLSSGDELLALTATMARYWQLKGQFSEARNWLQSALTRSTDQAGVPRARVMNALAVFQLRLGDFNECRRLLDASRQILENIRAEKYLADTLNHLGTLEQTLGNLQEATLCHQASLELRRAAHDRWGEAASLNNLGLIAGSLGDSQEGIELHTKSRDTYLAIGDLVNAATAAANMGMIHNGEYRYVEATELLTDALRTFREVGDRWRTAIVLQNLSNAVRNVDGCAAAYPLIAESARIWLEVGSDSGLVYVIASLADAALDMQRYGESLTIQAAHEVMRSRLHVTVSASEQSHIDDRVAKARAGAAGADPDAAWRRGAAMSNREALDYALAVCAPLRAQPI